MSDDFAAVMLILGLLAFGALIGFGLGYTYVIMEAGYCVDFDNVMTVVQCKKVQGW